MSLKRLIAQCRKQDRKAQEKIYREYSGKFFTLCLKYSANYEQAKDNLQDGFIKIFQNISQYKGKGSFEGWMTRIMINTSLKKFQKQTVYLTIDEEQLEDPEVEVDDQFFNVDLLIKLVQELPERYRLVFNLYTMEGYSHKQIAKALNITEGTSKSNLARARLKLKEKIESLQHSKLEEGYGK
ncbi:RNA polymerase sigma factor [Salinimicrobium sp. GXAS 041]|uniref:RNA polymerase sigma factor n=1 Tax=Salinimicrobium sp. GXAS 041 TaxID=3400806 RepID=UPI003C744E75